MRVLCAMDSSRGARTRTGSPADVARALEGELLRPPSPRCGDPACRCDQVWVGLASGSEARSAVVVDLDLQREGLLAAYADALADHGWVEGADDATPAWVDDLLDEALSVAATHPVGTVLHLGDQPAPWLAEAS